MTTKEIENYLDKESKSGNVLAITYVQFLKDVPSPIREYWYQYLGKILDKSRKL
jgi:hypothetical protein